MAHILCTGVAILDIVNYVDHYPLEDEKIRAVGQEQRLGGNAANTANVLTQYGHKVELLASLGNDSASDWLVRQLEINGISSRNSPRLDGQTPTSCITLNKHSGSRTIIHHRSLPELDYAHFPTIECQDFDWFHFEARNAEQTKQMLEECRNKCAQQTISLELEKCREGNEQLIEMADVLLFSRDYAERLGFTHPGLFLSTQQALHPDKKMTCTWGRGGAYGIEPGADIIHIPANARIDIVDTIGAGDTFNGGMINALLSNAAFPTALAHACHLATTKIRQQGFDQVVARAFNPEKSLERGKYA